MAAKTAKKAPAKTGGAKTTKKKAAGRVVKRLEGGLTVRAKRNGRHTVEARGGKRVNGEDKVKALVAAGLVKQPTKKKTEEAPAGEGA